MEPFDTGLDGLEVGQHTAEPSFVDIEHASTGGFFLDCALGLFLRSNEENLTALGRQFTQEVVAFFYFLDGLLQVNDIDSVAFREDVRSHLRVPAASLMTEVYACFKKLFHRYNSHFYFLLFFLRSYFPNLLKRTGTSNAACVVRGAVRTG